ncbi:hypothetical protein JYU34_003372 [Plutella xylostella]|uniref:Uncharacterized protein n=1 Tax=Plutella xylostella TaxID=51655 RepID=A0ABQ7QZV8_PLUXY|nr:hypothetical protein JYU34_003372 [Plutella xylostella]
METLNIQLTEGKTMALTLQESFDRSCRLCAEEQEVTIMIFSAEAEAMLLQNKLNKYLLIEIEEDDRLPKNICLKCCSKLHTVCEFIDQARSAQELLTNRSILLEQVADNISEALSIDTDIKSEPLMYFDDGALITPMEVSVDPMMVLQNAEGLPSPTPSCGDNHIAAVDDVSYLHGLNGENVTIKLIKKGEHEVGHIDIEPEPEPEPELEENTNSKKKKKMPKPFPCLICKRSFYTELALKNHVWIHSADEKTIRSFSCVTCNAGFDFRIDLMAHMKLHRTNTTCTVCGRVFRLEQNLLMHMETHRSPQSAYTCKVCGRSYNSISNLKTHSITHSNERPYKCHLCKKCFKRNQDLKFHINQHTGAKPYQCPFCDKSFASSGNCYSHRSRMHPGRRMESVAIRRKAAVPKPDYAIQQRAIMPKTHLVNIKGIYKYQCQICEHSFVKRDNFTYHMYQHTGEKPFQCSFCEEQFVTRRGLLIHHDKVHPTNERPLALLSKNALLK